jgi:hypothetical protein
MNPIRISATALVAVLLACCCALGADVPDDFKCGPIDCDTLKTQPMARFERIDQLLLDGKQIDDAERLAELRRRFWETYPSNPTREAHVQAREAFAQALFVKDLLYLQAAITRKLFEATSDASGQRGTDMLAKALELLSAGGIDGGIPQTAQPEFDDWAKAVWEKLGPVRTNDDIITRGLESGLGLLSPAFRKASSPGGKEYQAYVMERDWAEFERAKVMPRGFDNRANYGHYLYYRHAKLPYTYAGAVYESMVNALGADVVEAAVEKVRSAPKTEQGNLVINVPRPVKIGPGGSEVADNDFPMPAGVIGVYSSPLVAMERLACQDDDRRFLLHVLKGQFKLNRERLDPSVTNWTYAQSLYGTLEKAFGKDALLDAGHKLRTAPIRMTTGDIMNPRAIGATRGEHFSTLQDILARKDPRGYVRAMLAFNQSPLAPAGVDMDAAYKQLIATHGESALIEAATRMAAGRPNVAYYGEIDTLKQMILAPPAPEPVAEMIDCPDYIAWKKLGVGAKVTYAGRVWSIDRRGSGRLLAGPLTHTHAYQLQSITDEQAKLWFTEQNFDSSGTPRPPRDREDGYPAKMQKPTRAAPPFGDSRVTVPANTPIETGDETLVIQGRQIGTKWKSASWMEGRDKVTVKIWTSDEFPMPRGYIRQIQDRTLPGPPTRVILETFLQSFEGFSPGVAVDPAHPPAPDSFPPMLRTGPAPMRATPVPPTPPPKPPAPTSRPRPAPTTQAMRNQRLSEALRRAGVALQELGQADGKLQAAGKELPADIRAARERLMKQIPSASMSLQQPDFEDRLKALEDTTAVIEKYLKQ